MSLLVISTHPVQYHAPVYRALQERFAVPTTVIYGSDFSIAGYRDREFGQSFSWDSDLLSGYQSIFLSRVSEGGAQSYETVMTKGLGKALSAQKFDAILLQGYQPRFHLEAFGLSKRTGVPLLFRAETADINIQRSNLKQLLRDNLLRLFYRQFARLLYIGQESRSHYLRLGCSDTKLIFSPYCVDTALFDNSDQTHTVERLKLRHELSIPENKVVLLFSGKIVSRKAPDLLLEAVRLLPQEQRDRLTLLFLGDGDQRVKLEAESQVEPFIDAYFVGFRNQSEIGRYFHGADILVLPSRNSETWGLVVNEALFHGLPCIVSDRVGSGADLIKPGLTGEIFASDSAAGLAAAIERCALLLEQPGTSNQCKALVSRYSIEVAAQGIAKAYSEVTASA